MWIDYFRPATKFERCVSGGFANVLANQRSNDAKIYRFRTDDIAELDEDCPIVSTH